MTPADRNGCLRSLSPASTWLIAVFATLLLACSHRASASEISLWDAIRTPGHVVLVRHALAPGTGDPANFRIGDCATQRNLSAEGRSQSERIGRRLREHGIESAHVHSSQWCRCLDTARLLALGDVRPNALLNSFFAEQSKGFRQTERLRAWLAQQRHDVPLILVTHQVNITQLTDVYPGSGEMVVARMKPDGALRVLGSIRTD